MRRPHGNRARLGGVLLAAVLGALALLALPTLGLGKGGDGDRGPRAAGKIESFDRETGELVVDLAKGDTISGLVVRRTKIRCGKGRRHHRRGERHAAASQRSLDGRADDRGGRVDEADDPRLGEDRVQGDDPATDEAQPGDRRRRHGHRRCRRYLVPGTVVMRAEIVLAHGNAFYSKIGLLPPQHSAEPEGSEEPEAPEGE